MSSRAKPFEGSTTPGRDAMHSVARAVADVDAHVSAIQRASASFAEHAPRVAASFTRAALRSTAWLASQVPPSMRAPGAGTNSLIPTTPYVSPTEAATFLRKYEAVHDPASVLADMRQGRLTSDKVAAMKACYPKLYDEMCTRIQSAMADERHPPSFEAQKQISILFGIPASPSFNPGFVQSMQAVQTGKTAQPAHAGGSKGPSHGAPKRQIKGIAEAAALPGTSGG